MFSLDPASPEEEVARNYLADEQAAGPDGLLVVVDATNLTRSLFLAGQVLELGRPTVVAVNMIDLSRGQGVEIDFASLEAKLGCKVVPISARTGEGFDELKRSLSKLAAPASEPFSILSNGACATGCNTCPYAQGHGWAAGLASDVSQARNIVSNQFTDKLDSVLTHPALDPALFGLTMLVLFS